MSKLFLEIVPRTEEKFSEEVRSVSSQLHRITGVNIPYTQSCKLDTISAIDTIQRIGNPGLIVPHIRARDFVKIEWKKVIPNTDKAFSFMEELVRRWITEILIIQWDPHEGERDNPDISPEFIRHIKDTTQLRVYWAIDQYRNKTYENNRIEKKKWAWVDGFFTQPFFSTSEIEIAMNNWYDMGVLYWFAPVTTDKSRSYWENTNNVVFPDNFSIDPEDNIEFARNGIKLLHDSSQWAYLMPVRFDAIRYLTWVLN